MQTPAPGLMPALQAYRPGPALAPWLDGAVVVHLGPSLAASHFPAVPHAMLTMQFEPAASGEDLSPQGPLVHWRLCTPILFHTLSTRPAVHPHQGQRLAMGWLLRPGAAASLLARAATAAAVDQALPWQALAGEAEAARLAQQVQAARSAPEALAALLASLQRCLAQVPPEAAEALARLCALVGAQGVQAGPALGLGPRQLQRRCQAVLGISPKRFQRLVRFHQALSGAVIDPDRPGAALALDAGYCDQSHLARELRDLAGAHLGALLDATRPDSPWWPLASHRLLHQPQTPVFGA